MTEHSFDLAAALVDTAIERLATREYGITRILFHEFGQFPLSASHFAHDTGHTVKIWARDDFGLLAAAEASAPHVGGIPQGRIINFRPGHLIFGAIDTDTPAETCFFARGQQPYTLTARSGSAEWAIAVDNGAPQQFPSLQAALGYILAEFEPSGGLTQHVSRPTPLHLVCGGRPAGSPVWPVPRASVRARPVPCLPVSRVPWHATAVGARGPYP